MPGVRVTPTGHMNAGNARGSSVLGPPIESHLTIEELPRAGHQELANLLQRGDAELAQVGGGLRRYRHVHSRPENTAERRRAAEAKAVELRAVLGLDRPGSSHF